MLPLVEVGDELGHHLGVRLRGEGDPLAHKEFLQLRVILNDAVVDHGDLPAAADLGVGVYVAGGAVGGPAGVSDPRDAVHRGAAAEHVRENLKPPLGLIDLQRLRLGGVHRHAGAVVPGTPGGPVPPAEWGPPAHFQHILQYRTLYMVPPDIKKSV